MGYYKCGSVFRQSLQRLLHHPLTFIVKSRCGFIENQYRRILKKYSRNRKSLLLTPGQFHPSLPDVRIITFREVHNKFMGIGIFRRPNDLLITGIRLAVADIIHNRTGKQVYVLLNDPYIIPQIVQTDITDIYAVDQDGTVRYIIKSGNQTAKCCFSYPGGPHQRHIIPGLHPQIDVV